MITRKLAILLFFPMIIFVNILSIIVVSLIFYDSDASGKIGVFFPILFQIFWLTLIAKNNGLPVFGHCEVIPCPNALGGLLALIGSLITFVAYYFLSVMIARWWLRYTHRKSTSFPHDTHS